MILGNRRSPISFRCEQIRRMPIITLSDLAQIQRQKQGKLFKAQTSSVVSAESQQQLEILIQQKRLGLPIEPILKANPLLFCWLEQLNEVFPDLFNLKKKLYLNVPLTRQLNQHKIEAKIHLGMMRKKVHLFDFSICSSSIYWHNRVKLWIATQYFGLHPKQLKMTMFVLTPRQPITKLSICESAARQQQTQQWLHKLLSSKPSIDKFPKETSIQSYIKAIPEVPL